MARPKQQSAANPKTKTSTAASSRSAPSPAHKHVNFPAGDFEPIDPVWLLKAGAVTLLVALVMAYGSICFYVRYGAWRNLLRPMAAIEQTPSEAYTAVRFDSIETGSPRLTGWWIPAPGSEAVAAAAPTLLFLHGGDGSLGSNGAELDELHQAGVNLFAIDYRGYGQSQGPHPTEQTMTEDSSAALSYLVDSRHLAPATIIPYGVGLGAVLAAGLVQNHPELPVVGIDNPWPNAAKQVMDDPQYRFLPIGLLLPDRFDLEDPLNKIEKPKLLINGGPGAAESRHLTPALNADSYATSARLSAYFRSVSDPKMIVSGLPAHAYGKLAQDATVSRSDNDKRLSEAVSRFLGVYLPGVKPATTP